MAIGKEIRGKIKSVENTKKITKAMEMVAASKMRKAQERMRAARPYADKIRNITANLSQANPEYHSPFMRKGGDAKKVGESAGFRKADGYAKMVGVMTGRDGIDAGAKKLLDKSVFGGSISPNVKVVAEDKKKQA